MAEEEKVKLLEVEEVRQKIEDLKKKVGEMADYIHIDDRRAKLAELEAQQASGDFWNKGSHRRDERGTRVCRAVYGAYEDGRGRGRYA